MSLGRARIRRGAALMFALAAVIIVMTVILGMWSLMVSHVDIEEASRGYARAIQIAEAGANWQLNRMARCLPPGHPGMAGYTPYNQFWAANFARIDGDPQTLDWQGYSSSPDFQLPGKVRAYTLQIGGVNAWQPPQIFEIVSTGMDPDSGIQRSVVFTGAATGLADRYVLFGSRNLSFIGSPADPAKTVFLTGGYIGTNNTLTMRFQAPNTRSDGSRFGGCRLGLNAGVEPVGLSGWPNWDIFRQPYPVTWPSVNDVIRYIYRGKTPGEVGRMADVNNPNQIWYRTADDKGVYWQHFTKQVDQLTDKEFRQSVSSDTPLRVICLSVSAANTAGNLFVFQKIDMGPNDVLVLDVGPPPNSSVSAGPVRPVTLRILLDGAPGQRRVVTNLAYCTYGQGLAQGKSTGPTILWYNNATGGRNGDLTFTPNPNVTNALVGTFDTGGYLFTANPTGPGKVAVQGLVYGGNVTINSNARGVGINQVVADDVTLNAAPGPLTVTQPSTRFPVEVQDDPYRYVLYYRIIHTYREGVPGTGGLVPSQLQGKPILDYGTYKP